MRSRRIFDIAVVGAGMVGSALALALARRGLRVALLEERAPPQWKADDEVDLRVVALAPNDTVVVVLIPRSVIDRLGTAGTFPSPARFPQYLESAMLGWATAVALFMARSR